MIVIKHLNNESGLIMKETTKEIIQIFNNLSPESQQTFLMYARVAHAAEGSIRKSIDRALSGEAKPIGNCS